MDRTHTRITLLRTAGILGSALASRFGAAANVLLGWLDRHRQRRMLYALSDHMLKDIGISRADVESEARKRFWRE